MYCFFILFLQKYLYNISNIIIYYIFMKIPLTHRKKALLIVDVQSGFIVDRTRYVLPNIKKLIQKWAYDCIIYSISYNQEGSVWCNQIGWCEFPQETDILEEIKEVLPKDNTYKVMKLTRSIFKADTNIVEILDQHDITEVHICGFTTYDCVYASAQEASDLWYFTFVIEEACEARSTLSTHQKAIDGLRYLALTNNSDFVGCKEIDYLEL